MRMLEGMNIRDHFVLLCNLVNQKRLDGVMVQSCELVADVANSSIALLYLLDATAQNFVLSAGFVQGFSTWAPPNLVRPIDPVGGGNCPLAQVVMTGEAVCLDSGTRGYDISHIAEALDGVSMPPCLAVIPLRRSNNSFLGVMVVLSEGAIGPWLNRGEARLVTKSVAATIETRHVVDRQATDRANLEKSLMRAEQDRTALRRNVSANLTRRLVGRSKPMQALRERVVHVAGQNGPVMIEGEDGSGREKVARAIHDQSNFSNGPFVFADCGSLTDDIFAPELFGYKRGAIKGVASARKGLLRKAAGGTLYLDGVERLGETAQTMLFRLLDTGSYRPLGSERDQQISTRIVVSALPGLAPAAQANEFLPALYYLLRQNVVSVPLLSECREDIGDIVQAVLARLYQEEKKNISVDPALYAYLAGRPFPGDRRELEGLTRLAAMTVENGGVVTVSHFEAVEKGTSPVTEHSKTMPLPEALAWFEQDMIARSLNQAGGNRAVAAELLGVPKRTLADKCKKYGL